MKRGALCLAVVLGCLHVCASYAVLDLTFDDARFSGPDEHGLAIRTPIPEAMEVSDGALNIRSGKAVNLSSQYQQLEKVSVKDLERFLVRVVNRGGESLPMRIEIQPFGASKPALVRNFVLKADGVPHEYSAGTAGLASYETNRKGFYFRIGIKPGKTGGALDVGVEQVSLHLSQAAMDRDFLIVANEKLSFADDTLKAMRLHGLATDGLNAMRARLTPEKRAEFEAFYPEFYAALGKGRAALEQSRITERKKLEAGWRHGASFLSFGLNGYFEEWNFTSPVFQSSVDGVVREYFTNVDQTRSGLQFSPDSSRRIRRTDKPGFLGWAAQRREWEFRHKSGRMITWRLLESRLAPGTVLTTDADSLSFTPSAGTPNLKGVYAMVNGEKKLIRSGEISGKALSENFIVLLAGGEVPSVPWLVTFQKRPERILISGGKVTVKDRFREKSFGVSCLYGARPLNASWEMTGEAWAQCRNLNAIMNAMPYECEEYFKVDAARNRVFIRNVFQYCDLKNEWGAPAARIAPLPPVLALAKASGHPVEVKAELHDFNLDTVDGRYIGVSGEEIVYSLPIPSLDDDLFIKTDRHPLWTERMNRMSGIVQFAGYHATPLFPSLNAWGMVLESWCFLTQENKARVAASVKPVVERFLRRVEDAAQLEPLSTTHIFAERTEPFSGISYTAYGWKSRMNDVLILRDTTDLMGFELNAIARYARSTGDWQMLKEHFGALKKIYSGIVCRMEWSTMAVASTDKLLNHHIDMGPDSYVASEAMTRIARGVNETETAELALYVMSKQSIPITNTFRKRRYDMAVNSNWDWEKHLPELGYIGNGGISGNPWENAYLSSSFIFGCAYSGGLINLYRDFCKDEAARYEFSLLEKFFPQWADPQKQTRFNMPLTRHLMLRDMLGEETGPLEEIADRGVEGQPLGYSSPMLYSVAGAMIAGREAPLKLLQWKPAGIINAEFSFASSRAVLEFESAGDFELTLQSRVKPDEVNINGTAVSGYRYDSSTERLALKLGKGKSRVDLFYRGYSVPEFKRHAPETAEFTLTEEMRICREAFLKRNGNLEFNSAMTLDLSKLFNAELKGEPVRKFAGVEFDISTGNGSVRTVLVKKGEPLEIFRGDEPGRNISFLFIPPRYTKTGATVKYADGSTVNLSLGHRRETNGFCVFTSVNCKRFKEVDGVFDESQKELIPIVGITVKADNDIHILAATITR